MAAGQENSLNVQVKNVSNLTIFCYCCKAVALRYFFLPFFSWRECCRRQSGHSEVYHKQGLKFVCLTVSLQTLNINGQGGRGMS